MKALTIHPMYVEAMSIGAKTIECRTWKTDYRGDILITASAKKMHDTIPSHALLVAELYDIRKMRKDDAKAAFMLPHDVSYDQFAWCLRNFRLIEPIPVKGKLSLWNFDEDEKIKEIMTVDELLDLMDNNPDEYLDVFNRYWRDIYV